MQDCVVAHGNLSVKVVRTCPDKLSALMPPAPPTQENDKLVVMRTNQVKIIGTD
jgi:hypothetical protein